MEKILVTGAAGFIGFHLSKALCDLGYDVTGIDSVNDYYDVRLKMARVGELKAYKNFIFEQVSICDKVFLDALFEKNNFSIVINLAAQAGVRYSLEHPYTYIDNNIVGFTNILEACRNFKTKHLIFASSSSVYGANTKVPFNTNDCTDHPLSLYAATKKANEAMAHSYSALYGIPCTGLRFFTVYGPWGRPDMAYFSFTENLFRSKPIKLFNNGDMRRDFTYVDDIVKTICILLQKPPVPAPDRIGTELKPSESFAPYKLFNIGNNKPVQLLEFVSILEELTGRKAIIEYQPLQKGDMLETFADIDDLQKHLNYSPVIDIRTGLSFFVDWYKTYYGII